MRDSMNGLLIVMLLSLSLFLPGCMFGIAGLAINGTRQNVFINTKPKGATVAIEGMTAKSPAQFNLKRKRNYIVIVEKEGYESETLYINKETDPLVLYLDGFLPPYLFGTAWDLQPERIYVNLTKEQQS